MKRRKDVPGRGIIAFGYLRADKLLGDGGAGRVPGRIHLWLKKNQENFGESGSEWSAFSIPSLALWSSLLPPSPKMHTHLFFFQFWYSLGLIPHF